MFGLSIQVFSCWPGKGPSTTLLLILLTAKEGHIIAWYGWKNRLSWLRLWWSSAELSKRYLKTSPIMQFASFIIVFYSFFTLFFFGLVSPILHYLKAMRCLHPARVFMLLCWIVPLEWALFLSVGWDLWTTAGSCPTFVHLCDLPLRSLCQWCATVYCAKDVLLYNVPQPWAMLQIPRVISTVKGKSDIVCLWVQVSTNGVSCQSCCGTSI